MSKIIKLIFSLIFIVFISCSKTDNSSNQIPTASNQIEFRILEDGGIVLSKIHRFQVESPKQAKGALLRFPMAFKKENRKFSLKYKVNFAQLDGKKVPYETEVKDNLFKLKVINPEVLRPGKHEYLVSLAISGYNFETEKGKNFFWKVLGLQSMPTKDTQISMILPKTVNPEKITHSFFVKGRESDITVLSGKQDFQKVVLNSGSLQPFQGVYLNLDWQ